jgi:hypothetical protein
VSGTPNAVYHSDPVQILLIPWADVLAPTAIVIIIGVAWLLTRGPRARRRSRRSEDARILAEYRSLHTAGSHRAPE